MKVKFDTEGRFGNNVKGCKLLFRIIQMIFWFTIKLDDILFDKQ